jgi:hypothetical protein
MPTLVYTGDDSQKTPVPVSRFSAYYVSIENAEVAIPQNFQAVAGNQGARSQSNVEELAGIKWFCEGDSDQPAKDDAAFPLKTCSTHLQTLLLFHDCVNEATLESAYSGTQNWNSTYKATNRCHEGMKRMPQLRFSIRYDLHKALPNGWDGAPPLSSPPPPPRARVRPVVLHARRLHQRLAARGRREHTQGQQQDRVCRRRRLRVRRRQRQGCRPDARQE